MRKLAMLFALAFTLMAATCSGNTAQEVVDLVKKNCGIVVSVSDVAAALSAPNPVITGASAVAHAICEQAQKADSGEIVPVQDQPKDENKDCVAVVNGVCIHKEDQK